MKTKFLWITFTILLGAVQLTDAQTNDSKSQRVFSYCYAYNYDTKYFYVSPIVYGMTNLEGYFDPFPQALTNQWQNRLKLETDQFFAYEKGHMGWGWTDFDELDGRRIDMIREYRSKGFEVIFIDDFYFRQQTK